MDKLRGLEMVVRAADAGSFSKAARTLGVTPSAVSHAVAELEKDLRVSIFYRTTRQLRLTEDGQAIYVRGRDLLERLSELENIVARPSGRLRGKLRIGLSISLSRALIMPAIAQFMRSHPELRIEVQIMTRTKEMHAQGADVMLRVSEPPDSGLIARRIGRARFGIFASPSYIAHAGIPQAPSDLQKHSCLVYRYPGTDEMLDEWTFERAGRHEVVRIKDPAIVTDDREGMLAAMLGGAGLSRSGLFDPNWIKSGRVHRVLSDWDVTGGFPIFAMYRRTPRLAPKIAAFLEFAKGALAAFDPEELTLIHEKA